MMLSGRSPRSTPGPTSSTPTILRAALTEIAPTNDQGELYLTDVLALVRQAGEPVGALLIDDRWQTEGINDRIQLSRMNAEVNRRILRALDARRCLGRGSRDNLGTCLS